MARSYRWLWCAIPFLVFAAIHFSTWSTPGPYADAINPDYMVARLLHGRHLFPVYSIPGNVVFGLFPVLVQVYHGALPYYAALPVYAVLGTGLFGMRVAAFVFGALVLLAMLACLRSLRAGWAIALLTLLCLATDPAFILNWRTQFYITALPAALLLLCASLLAARPEAWRAGLAGLFAGVAIYGYFIYAFPVALLALALLPGLSWRARLWFLGGLALGLSPYLVGYLLVLRQAGSPGAFFQTMEAIVRGQAPAQSDLDLAGRFQRTLVLARLGFDNGGNTLMVLGVETEPRLAWIRWIALGAACIGVAWALLPRTGLRRQALALLACVAGFLLLGLLFGDRLWAHHYSSMPIWFVAGVALAMTLLWRVPRLGPPLAVLLAAGLIASNLATWRATALELEATGGRGGFSDAIARFADSTRQARRPVVAVADWGIVMPLAMLGQGRVEILDSVEPEALRRHLCAGRDVIVAIVLARGAERLPGWEAALGWGPASQDVFAQRDGVPILLAATWRAADRPAGAACQAARAPAPPPAG